MSLRINPLVGSPPPDLSQRPLLVGSLLEEIIAHGQVTSARAALGRGLPGVWHDDVPSRAGNDTVRGPVEVVIDHAVTAPEIVRGALVPRGPFQGVAGTGNLAKLEGRVPLSVERPDWGKEPQAPMRAVLTLTPPEREGAAPLIELLPCPAAPDRFWNRVPLDVLEYDPQLRRWRAFGWAPRLLDARHLFVGSEADAAFAADLAAAADVIARHATRHDHLPLWDVAAALRALETLLLSQGEPIQYCRIIHALRRTFPLCESSFLPQVLGANGLALEAPSWGLPPAELFSLGALFRNVAIEGLEGVRRSAQRLEGLITHGASEWRARAELWSAASVGGRAPRKLNNQVAEYGVLHFGAASREVALDAGFVAVCRAPKSPGPYILFVTEQPLRERPRLMFSIEQTFADADVVRAEVEASIAATGWPVRREPILESEKPQRSGIFAHFSEKPRAAVASIVLKSNVEVALPDPSHAMASWRIHAWPCELLYVGASTKLRLRAEHAGEAVPLRGGALIAPVGYRPKLVARMI